MTTQETIFLRSLIRFSVKNSNFQFSGIRMRIRVKGERLTFYLPAEYKICPRHWDAEAGEAITSPKRNPDIKGDPMLAVSLLNLNKEIERTADAFIEAYQEIKHAELPLTVEGIKAAMRVKLGRVEEQVQEVLPEVEAEPEPEQPKFDGLLEFLDFYISQCEKGSILNNKGLALSPGTIRNYKSARAAVNRYNKARRHKLGLHTFSISDYNDMVAFFNESTHARGKYCINVIGKFFKDLCHIMRHAYDYGYTEKKTYTMERTTIITTDVGYLIDSVSACVMELIERDRQMEIERRKAEIEPNYYTRQEAADKLKISLSALHSRIKRGDIPAYRIGGRTLFVAEDINKSLIRQHY